MSNVVLEATTVSQSEALSRKLRSKGPPPMNNNEIAKQVNPGILRCWYWVKSSPTE
ncbi:hypothetical protein THZG08_20225 [Vibrio owensii]|nr:hypothetical protein THZG08_20225 [Vibrio owensii]CAH1558575.1 hypothetical protein THOA03_20225 [Vibrio owensii]